MYDKIKGIIGVKEGVSLDNATKKALISLVRKSIKQGKNIEVQVNAIDDILVDGKKWLQGAGNWLNKVGISKPFKLARGSRGKAFIGNGVADNAIDAKEIILSDKIGDMMGENILHPAYGDFPSIDAISEISHTPLSYKQLTVQDKTNITKYINKAYKDGTSGIYNNNIKAQNGRNWANGKYQEWTGVDLHIEYPFSDVDVNWLKNSMWPAFARNNQRPFRNDGIIKQVYIHLQDGSIVKMDMTLLTF